jgi:D-alanine-D-alanine ligase
MSKPLAVIFESTVEAICPQVEIDELRENTEEIGAALSTNGFETHIIPFTLDTAGIRTQLEALKPAIVFNLTDSIEGKGNIISIAPMLCEHLGIAFTGAGSIATVTSCDKIITKQILRGANIPTADFETEEQIHNNEHELKAPYIIKSVSEHASFGMFADSVVSTRKELKQRLAEKKLKYGGTWIAEQFIDGREFNLSVIGTPNGGTVFPPAEILFTEDFPKDKPRIVDYAAKWHYDSAECIGTIRGFDFPPQDLTLLGQLEKISLECWQAFNLTGYARVDFRIDKEGNPWVLEINSNPFLTASEGMGAAAARAAISFEKLIGMIVEDALRRQPKHASIAA